MIHNYLKRSGINITPDHEIDHVVMGVSFKCHRPSTLAERTVDRLTLRPKVPQAYTAKLFCPQSVAAVWVGDVSLADGMHYVYWY
jgi:hypothetical protein